MLNYGALTISVSSNRSYVINVTRNLTDLILKFVYEKGATELS